MTITLKCYTDWNLFEIFCNTYENVWMDWCFMATPDAYHQPVINLKCSNTWRTDISQKDEIWFYAIANKKGALTKLSFSGWSNISRSVSIAPYIQDCYLDTFYKLIRFYFRNKAIVDLFRISKGVYFIQIISDSKCYTTKIVRE